MKEAFIEQISKAYTFQGSSIIIGCGMYEGQVVKETVIRLPLRMMNRHGLIAGATGTGNTKSFL